MISALQTWLKFVGLKKKKKSFKKKEDKNLKGRPHSSLN